MIVSVLNAVVQDKDEWQVWIGLEEDVEPPGGFSFCVGMGCTRDAAVAEAVAELEKCIDQLQWPRL